MTRPEPRPTTCCSSQAYADPLFLVGAGKTRFAAAPRCSKCHKIVGDYKLDWTQDEELKKIQKKFSMTSWAMMRDVLLKRPSAPLNFEMGTAGVVPEGYTGEKKYEPELLAEEVADEPPF